MDWSTTTKTQEWGTKKKVDPTKGMVVVGGIVAEKEWKNLKKYTPVDSNALLTKYLQNSNCPLMQLKRK